MNRREIITLLIGIAATLPRLAFAQPSGRRTIGFINGGSSKPFAPMAAAFLRGLKEVGFINGDDVEVIFRWADGEYSRLPELAADLVSRNVEVIAATGGDVSALAARAATTTIPIVFNIGGDPVHLGLVTSLNSPGKNVTGVVMFTFELATKRLEILRDLMPGATRVAVLMNPTRPNAEARVREVEGAARAYGKRLVVLNAAEDKDFDAAFATLTSEGAEALLVGSDPFFLARRQKLVQLAARHAMPTIYEGRDFPAVGGLMSYGTSLSDAYRQVGVYVGRVLKGERPADLPVVQSTKFELVINLKTAQMLGLDISPILLAQADEVIE